MAKTENRAKWWKNIFKKPDYATIYWNDVLSGKLPFFTTDFGEDVYASDVVQQAVYSIVSELKKLDPVHIRRINGDVQMMDGNIQNVLDNPNPLMTTSDFIEKVAWMLLLNYNAFVYPLWDGDTLKALYPLQPSEVAFDTDFNGTGETWVRFTFPNGYQGDLPYDNLIHLRYKFSVSEFMGGDENGSPNYKPILDTLKLNDTLLKGLAKSLNMQTVMNGLIKIKTMQNYEDQVAKIKEFERKLQSNESGIGITDVSSEFTPFTKQVQFLDATTLEFIDKKILRNWGVSIPIVNGDFTKEQYEAFYQKACEHIVKTFSQGFTKGIFTKRQASGFKNEIAFFQKEMIFMSITQKLELFKELGARGSCYENEYRVAFGLRPMRELEGKRMMSLNYIDTKDAKQYQTGENGGEGA